MVYFWYMYFVFKDFDTVNHNILIEKLDYYGICDVTKDWFTSYLTNRCLWGKLSLNLSLVVFPKAQFSADSYFLHQ